MNENSGASYDPFRTFTQAASPPSKRNTKNLSLQLNKSNNINNIKNNDTDQDSTSVRSRMVPPQTPSTATSTTHPMTIPSRSTAQVYRHPSISRGSANTMTEDQSFQLTNGPLSRRATLSLAIPTDIESSKSSSGSKLSSTNSIPSFSTSSPLNSSPLIPATPKEDLGMEKRSSSSSTSTLRTIPPPSQKNSNGEILKTQTLIRDFSNYEISDEGDHTKMNAYPDGPACVLPPNLYLYSEPKLSELSDFDLVVNVAKELSPPLPHVQLHPPNSQISHYTHEGTEYYYVPWAHTSKLCGDLPLLTDVISKHLDQNKKVLIHCQCGVSRSASLVVALFMKMKHIQLNEAYNMLKERAPEISPNMSLIFQLMEWGDVIGVNGNELKSDDDDEYSE